MDSATPCDICGEPTHAERGVCGRTPACRAEGARRRRVAKGSKPRQYKPCLNCGHPTDGQYQICKRTPECQSAAHQARVEAHGEPPRTPCVVCGNPTRSTSGACTKTAACRTIQHQHRYRVQKAGDPPRPPCEICGQPTRSAYSVCGRTEACKREQDLRHGRATAEETNRRLREWGAANPEAYREKHRLSSQRYRAAHPETNRETQRKVQHRYLQRTDRTCRYAHCTKHAIPSRYECTTHTAAADTARRERETLRTKLATDQGHICPWCNEELPPRLADTHIDHIIPIAHGGPDEEWNYQLLHKYCNLAKRHTLTPKAIRLATEHGINLGTEQKRSAA